MRDVPLISFVYILCILFTIRNAQVDSFDYSIHKLSSIHVKTYNCCTVCIFQMLLFHSLNACMLNVQRYLTTPL